MDRKKIAESDSSPIRVLFIASECTPQDFTGERELVAWYEGVLARYCGNQVCVAVAFGDDDGTSRDVERTSCSMRSPHITYFPLNVNLEFGAEGAIEADWERSRAALLGVVDRFKPDIIHCLGSERLYGAIAEDVSVPVVIHMMGFLTAYFFAIDMANGRTYEEPLWRAVKRKLRGKKRDIDAYKARCEELASFERRIMKANRYFLGRTNWDRNIVKYYSPGSHYFNVPECIRYQFLREAGSWHYHFNGKPRLLTVSSADDRKGIEIILQTAKLLKELVGIDFEWRIAGHKHIFHRFEQRCGIRHGNVNVQLLGMLEQEDIVKELKSADLFIHPSIIDNSPRAICEAQLIGCPVIASNVGGVPQLVEDGTTGFLYPYGEPHALAFLIANLMEQPDMLTAVSQTAVRVSRERHDPERIARRTLDVYRQILSLAEE